MKQEIRLKDIYSVAFLLNENQYLMRTENDGAKFWFIFEDTPRLNELINAYWRNEAKTNVKSYVNCIQDLKDRIFANR